MSNIKISSFYKSFFKMIKKNMENKVQIPFTVELWDSSSYLFGEGDSHFKIIVRNSPALAALSSFDELRIGEAYVNESLNFEGDMMGLLSLRGLLRDVHPLLRLWRILVPLFTRKLKLNRKSIATHYDFDSDFYLSFMDDSRCYSQAVFYSDDEPLELAQKHKLEFAVGACGVRPGDEVLDIGGGWGSFTEYAGKKGIHVTSITISDESEKFIKNIIEVEKLPCHVINVDFLAYDEEKQYDAVVILGVMEHLPDYLRVIRKLDRLLKPGGRVYLDASATDRKFDNPIFLTKYIFPGGHTTFCLHEFLTIVASENFDVISVHNDRRSYMLTCKAWAEKLDLARENIVHRWGEHIYRLFRIYLWTCVHGFKTGGIKAYRVVLEKYNEK